MQDLRTIVVTTRIIQYLGYASLLGLISYSLFNSWWWFLASILYYKFIVGLFSNQISQHRYISHNSFKTGALRHKFLAWASLLTSVSPVLYASIHRHHHNHSDTEKDPHSPSISIWHALGSLNKEELSKIRPALDVMRDRDFMFVHKHGQKIFVLLFAIVFIISWKIAVFILLAGVGWNHLHMTVIRSALVHMKLPGSYKNFELADNSWNNKWIHAFDLGEGLHNNHHRYPNRYNEACVPGEFDFAGWIVKKFFATS